MELERKIQYSIHYWIRDKLPNLTTKQVPLAFPTDEEIILPCIAIEGPNTAAVNKGLGECDLVYYYFNLDIFTNSPGQRDDYKALIFRELEQGIPVYNYDEGFPPDNNPSQIGLLVVRSRTSHIVSVLRAMARQEYYWATIGFSAYLEEFGG